MTRSIADIRKDIDTVDRDLQDLLIKRAELAVEIGEEKKKANTPMIQPDREAVKVRSVLARHKGPLPRAMVTRVWRELIGAASMLQTELKVAIAAPANNAQEHWDMAREYFGSVVPLQGVANPLIAISALREGDADFAVLPWPEDDIENPWWCHLNSDDKAQTVRVVVRLPYGDRQETVGHPEHRAVILAKMPFNASGEDNSFLFFDLDQVMSRARVVDKAKALGFNPISINNRRVKPTKTRSQHFLEVEGYVASDDPRLAQLLEKLESPEGTCLALGGYPVIPSLVDKKDTKDKKSA
jgi:chorismate mutase